jgi:hypothetical protein
MFMKIKLPLKMSVLKAVADSGPAGADDILKLLAPAYGTERQFRKPAIENHLLALRAVGLVEVSPGGESKYAVTPAGLSRIEKLKKADYV